LEAVAGDVETLALKTSFEVIVAADTIEHAENAGRFLGALEQHLAPGGSILITTPNPNGLVRILELVVKGRSKANPAHTCWYTGQVLDQLARRVGLTVAEEAWIDEMRKYHRPDRGKRLARRVASRMLIGGNRVACRLFPQLSETCAFVLIRR
jgi:SAM-dependent methyltransferase